MSDHYILDNRKAVKADLMTYAKWFEKGDRRVGKTEIGDISVSTVFLGLDHSFSGGPPMLFETMVFGGEHDGDCERCTTWEEAEAQHKAMCAKVKP